MKNGVVECERLSPFLARFLDSSASANLEDTRVLKRAVLGELERLLNTACLPEDYQLTDYPQVKTSTINYGVADFAGKIVCGIPLENVEKQIGAAIVAFEPRLVARSLRCVANPNANSDSDLTEPLALLIDVQMKGLNGEIVNLNLATEFDLSQEAFVITERTES
ncbi:type VI secretion system baseplate subunit TssE [Paraferrimonas sedimenticola]|uniref:IraD/Gp25-like domain-containing protein n=1 Tax=Paraferrimonas sedimenticola TaxID=375674 RepID=A0AA37RX23_9GAMM|nr:GPW/gp25 family protein [Paraferrimonas sedimenticola]GLP96843.1 hypothetical protein GCM10007895_21490 [Paraferrimonas sedimenticola]